MQDPLNDGWFNYLTNFAALLQKKEDKMPNGRGRGQGRGGSRGMGRGGGGRGMGPGGRGLGPGGNCVCPNCGTKVPHQVGVSCMQMKCPNCGTPMVRE